MKGHAEQCVQRHCEMVKKSVSHPKQVETQCIDDHQLKKNDFEVVGELVLSAHRSCCNAYILPDLVELTCCGQVTRSQEQSLKWNRAFDQKLAQLTSYIHFTNSHRKPCYVAHSFKLALYHDASFASDLQDSKSPPRPQRWRFAAF